MDKSEKEPTVSTLLSIIGKLKSEHQRYIFKLNKQNEKLQNELSALKKKSAEDNETIQFLHNENQTLQNKLKQFECEEPMQNQNEPNENGRNSDENVFEVDEIIGDKIKQNKKYYLVRWKGYGKDHDSWEPSRNLNCKEVLRRYEQSKRKK